MCCGQFASAVILGLALASTKTHTLDKTWHHGRSIRGGADPRFVVLLRVLAKHSVQCPAPRKPPIPRATSPILHKPSQTKTTTSYHCVFVLSIYVPRFLPDHYPVPDRHRRPVVWVYPSTFSPCRNKKRQRELTKEKDKGKTYSLRGGDPPSLLPPLSPSSSSGGRPKSGRFYSVTSHLFTLTFSKMFCKTYYYEKLARKATVEAVEKSIVCEPTA